MITVASTPLEPPDGDARPHHLYGGEGPRVGGDTVSRRQQAARREREREARSSRFQCVHREHETQRGHAGNGEHERNLEFYENGAWRPSGRRGRT